ncbi:hypothetical protein O181_090390, partial [Austropuccinia psidii MF-1]|nr:hypothetical protein [Austropuccinia psidii MF-1]
TKQHPFDIFLIWKNLHRNCFSTIRQRFGYYISSVSLFLLVSLQLFFDNSSTIRVLDDCSVKTPTS